MWTPRRSDVSQANGERLSSSQPTQLLSDSVEGIVVTLDRLSGICVSTDSMLEDSDFSILYESSSAVGNVLSLTVF